MNVVTIASEGLVDAPLLTRILTHYGLSVGIAYGGKGRTQLDRRLSGYCNAAKYGPWIVLRDLDADAACAPALHKRLTGAVARRIGSLPPDMCLIVAVPQTEAWLLADQAGIAAYLHVARATVPVAPESLTDAKRALIELAGRSSERAIRDGMVPTIQSGRKVGTRYTEMLQRFIAGNWDINRAISGGANSLAKLRDRIERFRTNGAWARAAG